LADGSKGTKAVSGLFSVSKIRLKDTLITSWLSSFRAKLYAGFFGIALLTLFITGFALYLFNQFGEIVNTTASEAIPELMAVMGLSANSALLAAGAPVLAASQSEQELRQTETRLNTLVQEINSSMDQLSASDHGATFDTIKWHSATITKTLVELKEATQKRLVLQHEKYSDLGNLRGVQGDLVDTLNPIVYGATSLANLFARRAGRQDAADLKDMMESNANVLIEWLEIQSATYRLASVLGNSFYFPSEQWWQECRLAIATMRGRRLRHEAIDGDSHRRGIAALVRGLIAANPCHTLLSEGNSAEYLNVTDAIQEVIKKLDTLIPKLQSKLQVQYLKTSRQVKSSPVELVDATIQNLRYALEIKAESNLLIGLLTAVTDADDRHTITNLFNRFKSSLEVFRNAVGIFQNSDLAKRNPILATQVLNLKDRLVAFGSGDDTLFDKRKNELVVSEQISGLLATHREQATSLTAQANKLVATVQKNVFNLRDTMEQRLVTAISILVGVCFGSLLIAAFIATITTLLLSRHEADLQAANRAADLLNQELETFNYSVSHDLRAPLRSLSGFSQALLEDYGEQLDEEGKSYLQYLKESSEEMGELIAGLLQLSRSTRGEITLGTVNLSEMARSIEHALRKSHPDRDVIVTITPGIEVNGDRRLIGIVMENLLGNAWKYTSKKQQGEIIFGRRSGNGPTTFFVQDNGVGFDISYASKLFKPFQRLHNVEEFEGTGVGLATVQRIIRRHGGRIWAYSEVDRGATFFFTLETGGIQP
jgi:signal transduction histidine kinase